MLFFFFSDYAKASIVRSGRSLFIHAVSILPDVIILGFYWHLNQGKVFPTKLHMPLSRTKPGYTL